MEFKTCWRCGVDYVPDTATYTTSAPCLDCIESVQEDYTIPRNTGGRLTAAETEQRMADVKRLHQAGLLDPEIAARMGIGRSAVSRWRKKLGLKPQPRPEKHMWKDIDAHMEHAATMVQSRKTNGRGKSAYDNS